MWDKIKGFFQRLWSEILGFLSPLAREIANNGGKLLMEAALAAVIAAEQAGGSGEEKFKTAKNTVIKTLEAKGFAIVLNAVHGAIEAALAKAKQDGTI